MKTLEILFHNRRKEKLTADTISLTEAPGWVVLKTDGGVAEMIPASVVKRIRIVPAAVEKAQAPASVPVEAISLPVPERSAGTPPPVPDHLLKLPIRPPYMPARPQPIVPSRRFA